jgi:hypothetical protein
MNADRNQSAFTGVDPRAIFSFALVDREIAHFCKIGGMVPRSLLIAVAILLLAAFGLGFYALHLKRTASQAQPVADTHPMAPPAAGPMIKVPIWVANDSDGTLHVQQVAIASPGGIPPGADIGQKQMRARQALRALIAEYRGPASAHPLAGGADVNEVFCVSTPAAAGGQNQLLAVVDVNAALANAHRSGILVEELTLASMAQTLAANVPGITQMKVLVEGKERETLAGHASLQEPYDVARASRLARHE